MSSGILRENSSGGVLCENCPSTRRARTWRHPRHGLIEVPYLTAAAIAVMNLGVSEYSIVASAVGLTVQEVRGIDVGADPSVVQLRQVGMPRDQYFKLDNAIRCPKCKSRIKVVPCVACATRSLGSEEVLTW